MKISLYFPHGPIEISMNNRLRKDWNDQVEFISVSSTINPRLHLYFVSINFETSADNFILTAE